MKNYKNIGDYLWKNTSKTNVNIILRTINARFNGYDDKCLIREMKYNDLIAILENCEHLEQITRVAISLLEGPELVQYDKQYKTDSNTEYVVEPIEEALKKMKNDSDYEEPPLQEEMKFHNGVFEFYTPLTFKRPFKKNHLRANYHLAFQIQETINKWTIENNFDLKNYMEPPYFLVMKRVVPKYIHNRHYDADNFENQRIINKITDAFGLNDGAKNMHFVSLFEENPDKKAGVYFYIFETKDIEKLISLVPDLNVSGNDLLYPNKLFAKVKKLCKKIFSFPHKKEN